LHGSPVRRAAEGLREMPKRDEAGAAALRRENAELRRALADSLDRQTATSNILHAIASSPAEAERALDTICHTAMRMFGASSVGIRRIEDGLLRNVGSAGPSANELRRARPFTAADASTLVGLTVMEKRQIHVPDLSALPEDVRQRVEDDPSIALAREAGVRTVVTTPLLRESESIGAMIVDRNEPRPFSTAELDLLKSFADQAVIAIENARLLDELNGRNRDLAESLEQQTATSEVLRAIASSPGDAARVLDTIVQTAQHLLGATGAAIVRMDEGGVRRIASAGLATPVSGILEARQDRGSPIGRAALEKRTVHVEDILQQAAEFPTAAAVRGQSGNRTILATPLMREGEAIGAINVSRTEVRPFTAKEIELLESFADQAVIAIENSRLLDDLNAKNRDLAASLERQTATSDILRAIASTPGEPHQALDAIAKTAARMFSASAVGIRRIEGGVLRMISTAGPTGTAMRQAFPDVPLDRTALLGRSVIENRQILIVDRTQPYEGENHDMSRQIRAAGVMTSAYTPLPRGSDVIGAMVVHRNEARPFQPEELESMRGFADQAVIAIENARLLDELRARTDELAQRQAELRVTFDNMGDGVVMFDQNLKLAAWNRNLQQILDIPQAFFAEPRTYRDYVTYLIERGEFTAERAAELAGLDEDSMAEERFERTRPNGQVLEVRRNPVPGGGFVLIFSDITERKRAEGQVRTARDAAERALGELKAAQANLIQAEKMASLGQLTAGIAHEIKNPLNFVNNFAGLSVELLDELKDAAASALDVLDQDKRGEIDEVVGMLTSNLEKIAEHGRRADGIVKSMLAHSRGGSGERQTIDLNALVEEALNLAYHGARAQDQTFNITMERDLDPALAPIEVVPQDLTRVFLNLFGNGFYAANKRRREAGDPDFSPVLKVTTRDAGAGIEIRIRDNGTGIPPELRAKLFEPFFTTKPTGEGTGLGLSISYEIVTRQHGGEIAVESEPGAFTEFRVTIPKRLGAAATIETTSGGETR
jgi:signal transduction histidine kinase